jgi:hypothetical protein
MRTSIQPSSLSYDCHIIPPGLLTVFSFGTVENILFGVLESCSEGPGDISRKELGYNSPTSRSHVLMSRFN